MVTEILLSILFETWYFIIKYSLGVLGLMIDTNKITDSVALLLSPISFFAGVFPLVDMFIILNILLTARLFFFVWDLLHWGIRKIPGIS